MNKKEFYLKNMFDGYTDNMPDWLKREEKKELQSIQELVDRYSPKGKIRILDVGCGSCRVFKEISFPCNNKRTKMATDIFSNKELPKKFKKFLKERQIKYQQLFNGLVAKEWGKFDVITCMGVDPLLNNNEAFDLWVSCIRNLKKEGILIWHINRDDTLKGKLLKWKDRELHYFYREDFMYSPYLDKKETKVSKIYLYRGFEFKEDLYDPNVQ